MLSRLGPCALLLATAAGCSDDPAPHYNTVVHLDPRLEDGRSSAVALAQSRRVVASFPLDGGVVEGGSAWSLVDGDLRRAFPQGGVRVVASETGSGRVAPFGLRHDEPLRAADFNVVEVDVRLPKDAGARMVWRSEADPEAYELEAAARVAAVQGVQTIRLFPGLVAGWTGEVHSLRVEPSADRRQQVDVQEIRFVRQGFQPGFEPLEPASAGEPLPGDGGIVVQGYRGVRSWPADVGVPLVTRATVPPDGLLVLRVAAPGPEDEVITFRVESRDPQRADGEWELLARGKRGSGTGWGALSADLAPWSGREVELRFVAGRDGDEAVRSGAEPVEAHALFGAPRILGREARAARPSIVLVTLDTLRADHVLDPEETPNLCRIAAEGIAFDEAWSACNATTPSHASILSGLHIVEHGATSNRTSIPSEVRTLAESFRAAGYDTAAAVSVAHIQAGVGFGQGFDFFHQAEPASYLDGNITLATVYEWIDEWEEVGGRPFFLWLHLFDPHGPYLPPEEFLDDYRQATRHVEPPSTAEPPTVPIFPAERVPGDLAWLDEITNHDHVRYLYRAGVAYTDGLMGDLVGALDDAALTPNTALVITADHGEALGEHSVYYGHAGLFPETLRVPLLIRAPGGPAGVRIAEPVSTIDIAPTLLALADIPSEPEHVGVDLIEVGRAGSGDPQRRLWFHYTRENQVGLLDHEAHFVETLTDRTQYTYAQQEGPDGETFWTIEKTPKGTTFLWDPQTDPARAHDLSAEQPQLVEVYLGEVREWAESLRMRRTLERALTAEEEEKLDALGYGGD
ncbi:MAG: sulfatase [Planctomycetota bacterium]